jgi:hypothetical protein
VLSCHILGGPNQKEQISLEFYIRYEGVSKSFRTGRLERELQMVQLSATRCSCIAILSVSLVSFAAISLCVASQRVFIVVSVYFVIDSVRKLLNTPSYICILLISNSVRQPAKVPIAGKEQVSERIFYANISECVRHFR